nr:probable carbohydrate esterase At4g34215 [Tanacetum cinerariifolium]
LHGFPQSSKTEYDEVTAFSGVLTPSLVRDVYETELEHGGIPVFDENEIFSVMKSPVATDDESPEDSMWIDLGQSPIGSPSSVMPLPPPFWFTRKNRNNNVKKVENFGVKPHSSEIQEDYEAESSFRVLRRRVSFGLEEKNEFISDEDYYESDRKEPERVKMKKTRGQFFFQVVEDDAGALDRNINMSAYQLLVKVALASGEGTYIETVREAQLGIKLPNVKTVDAKGLQLQPDGLHLSTPAQAQVGEMLAHAVLQSNCYQ